MFIPKLPGHFYQLLAALLGDLLSLSYGVMFGITPSALVTYQSEQTPLNRAITEDEASWITSYMCLGAILGTVLLGSLSDRFGRKIMLQWSGLFQIVGWGSLLFGYQIWHIYLSRFLVGVGAGGAYILLPIYVAEISEDQSRGSLGSYLSTLRSLGILIGFVIGAYLEYDLIPYVGAAISTVFTLAFPFVQESPYFFVMKKDIPMIEKSLRWFRGIRSFEDRSKREFMMEVNKFRDMTNSTNETENNEHTHGFCSCFIFKILTIALVLVTTTQFCGIYAVLNYANVIFTDISSGFSANESGIILAVTQFLATYLATLIADNFNRKILISLTSFGSGVFLATFGATVYLRESGLAFGEYKWIPLLCLCLTIVLANMGLYPLGFVVMAEIFPQKSKRAFTTFFMAYAWLLAFVSVKYYYLLVDLVGVYGCMWIFSGFCFFEFAFTLCFIPETRGKSFAEIQVLLDGRKAVTPE